MGTELWVHSHLRLAHYISVEGEYLGRVYFTRYDSYKQNPEHARSALPQFTVILLIIFYYCVINYHIHSYFSDFNPCIVWLGPLLSGSPD